MLALIMLINRSGAMVIPFLGVYLSSELHFSVKDTGIVLSCFGGGAVCGSALGGWLSDKAGNFNVQFYCLLLTIPVFCILPHLHDLQNVALAVFLLGLITETFRPANSVSITSYATPDSLTRAISLNRMAMNLGFSIGPALGGLLAGWSYSWLFYGNAISTAMAALIFYFYFRNKEGRRANSVPKKNSSTPTGSLWKDTPFILFCILCSLYCICFFQLLSTLPLFYKQYHHLSEWSIGLILAYSGMVVFSLEMVLVHFAEKRWSSFNAIIIGVLLVGTAYVSLLLPGKYLLLYFSMLLLCLSEILAMPFMGTITLNRAPEGKQGVYMGLNSVAFSIAHVLSPVLGTRIADAYGFNVLWLATGVLSVITAAGFFFLQDKMKKV